MVTLKDIILLKRANQESIITENLLPEDVLTGEVILCYEDGKERLYCKNTDGVIVPLHRIWNGEEIIVEEPDEVFLVDIDARLIIQVIINLVNNAIKYTPKGSRIVVSSRRICDRVAISVTDNGPGVPEELKDHLFEMFATCHNTVADARRSLGLGLGLCKSIMDAHEQVIMYDDNPPHGARFTFTMKEINQ